MLVISCSTNDEPQNVVSLSAKVHSNSSLNTNELLGALEIAKASNSYWQNNH